MPRNVDVVAICGSLSDDSCTRTALRTALDAASDAGASTELVDLREYDLPVFDSDRRDAGDASSLSATVEAADAVLLGTPLYHGSYAAPMKNALDYLGRDELGGKTVGLLAVAGGSFPRRALDHLCSVSRSLDAWVLPLQVGIPNASSHVVDGELVEETLAERTRRLGEQAVAYAGVEEYPESNDTTGAPVATAAQD